MVAWVGCRAACRSPSPSAARGAYHSGPPLPPAARYSPQAPARPHGQPWRQRGTSSSPEVAALVARAASPRAAGGGGLLELEPPAPSARPPHRRPLPEGLPLLDAEAMSADLGGSWLSHWRAVEAAASARAALQAATRGRQRWRQLVVASLVGQQSQHLGSGPQGSWDEEGDGGAALALACGAEVAAADPTAARPPPPGARLHLKLPPAAEELPPLSAQPGAALDDLSWLASHPPGAAAVADAPPPEAAHEAAVGAAAAGQMRAWAAHHQPAHDLVAPVELRVGWERVSVRPLWICVLQQEGSATAKLFESVAPLRPALVDRLRLDLAPFAAVSGLAFGQLADDAEGPWSSYFVGLVGEVAVVEDEILWPNQVLHRDRVLYNLRSAWDVAKFLADPQLDDVLEHRANLERLAEERGYRRGWCWHMLRSRWGEAALAQLGVQPEPAAGAAPAPAAAAVQGGRGGAGRQGLVDWRSQGCCVARPVYE
eukprot:scaffold30.g4435.t1